MDIFDYINRPTILESVYGLRPKNFWLVLDVSAREPEKMKQLSTGILHGLKGISSHREIVLNWFLVARNAFIIMNADEVFANNQLEEIQYDNPDQLVSNNMDVLHRIFDKAKTNAGYQGLMFNVQERVIPILARETNNHELAYLISSYNLHYKIADQWNGNGINTVDDLAEWTLRTMNETVSNLSPGSSESIAGIKLFDIKEACYEALRKIGHLYHDEYEWIIRSDSFHIPRKSRLVIATNLKIKIDFENGSKNKTFGNSYAYERVEALLKAIADSGLDEYYSISFIDEIQYGKLTDKVRSQRKR